MSSTRAARSRGSPYLDKFDAVVSVGVLEHVKETGGSEIGSLREIFRILKLNGYLSVTTFPTSLA